MSDLDGEVSLEIQIEASVETVFAFLTEPELMQEWLTDMVDTDCRPGGKFRIKGMRGGLIEGAYLEIVPNQKVVFTWGGFMELKPGESTVEFRITPHSGGTLLRLHHYGLPEPRIEPHRQGWGAALPKLKEAAERHGARIVQA